MFQWLNIIQLTDNGKIPTCTEVGYTADVYCSYCKEVLTEFEIIPKVKYILGDWTISLPATCISKGQKIRECNYCDYKECEK